MSESLLHDVPQSGGRLRRADYENKVMARLAAGRDLRLASFMGAGLRALRVRARGLTATGADRYGETVAWAEVAHMAGFDGLVWVSRHCNTDRAYVLFGDRVAEEDVAVDPSFARIVALSSDVDWLSDFCTPLHIGIRR